MRITRAALSAIALLIGVSVAGAQDVNQQQIRPGIPQPRDRSQQKTGTAMISGRITAADTGAPLRRVQVRISGAELRRGRTALTDADGRYFVRELPAGRYTVFATKPGYVMLSYGQKRPLAPNPTQQGTPIELADGQKLETVNIALPRGGVLTGHVLDDFGEPVVDARVTALQYRWVNGRRRAVPAARPAMTNDRGEYRIWGLSPGEYYVGAAAGDRTFGGPDESVGTSGDNSGYAPTYYPGTGSIDEAQRVTVGSALEAGGIDLSLALVRTVRVSGTAMTSDGHPMTSGFVTLMPRTEVEGGMMMMMGNGGSLDSNGAFTVNGVAPGDYVLMARGSDQPPGPGEPTADIATANITVGGEDLRNVMLTAAKGVRVSGRVVYEGGTPSDSPGRMQVMAFPVDSTLSMMLGGTGSTQVTAQGTFEMRSVLGKRRLFVSGPMPDGWFVKSVRVGATEISDTGYDFGKEDVSNVEIVLTNHPTIVSGTVKNAQGEAVTDAAVLIFPADEEHWTQAMSRRVTSARLDQNGAYRIRALPPGTYYALALDSQPDEWGNPELFAKLKPLATSFTLTEGQTDTVELRLKELPQ